MTRNEHLHPVVIINRDGKVEKVMGFFTFRQHDFYKKLVCEAENITMAELEDCGDNLFKLQVEGKKWSRQVEAPDVTGSVLDFFTPSTPAVYTFKFVWLQMDMEEVDKFKQESYHCSE